MATVELTDEYLRGYRAGTSEQRKTRRVRVPAIVVAALIVAVAILGAAFLYVGEKHRALCIRDGYVGCSMLPWSGHPAAGSAVIPGSGSLNGVVIP